MRGGYRAGAGRQPQRQKAEGYWTIDIRQWVRLGLLRSERVFGWSMFGQCDESTALLQVRVGVETVSLTVRTGKVTGEAEKPAAIVGVESTPCNFGGSRHWFRCPSCRRRVALLYFNYGNFACRRCLGLAYTSQSLSPIDRSWRQQQRIESRLAGKAGAWDGESKPSGMHRATFERLYAGLAAVQSARGAMAASAAGQWLNLLG
jgi:hypothetical protein